MTRRDPRFPAPWAQGQPLPQEEEGWGRGLSHCPKVKVGRSLRGGARNSLCGCAPPASDLPVKLLGARSRGLTTLNPKRGVPQPTRCSEPRGPHLRGLCHQGGRRSLLGTRRPGSDPRSPTSESRDLPSLSLSFRLVLLPPRAIAGISRQGRPRHRGDGDAAGGISSLQARSGSEGIPSRDNNSQPSARPAPAPTEGDSGPKRLSALPKSEHSQNPGFSSTLVAQPRPAQRTCGLTTLSPGALICAWGGLQEAHSGFSARRGPHGWERRVAELVSDSTVVRLSS